MVMMTRACERVEPKQSSIVKKTILPALFAAPYCFLALSGILASGLFAGCSSNSDYPTHLAFPSRTDRLVLKVPETAPANAGAPGRREAEVAELDGLGGKTAEPVALPLERRSSIDQFLRDTFGTPSSPKVDSLGDEELRKRLTQLGLEGDVLTEGGKLFRAHCLGCHGMTGDGRGQAGLFLNPYPRDFRRGVFKFTSTGEGQKPRRADLLRTITEGLKGTAMPPFGLRSEPERNLLAEYVTYLAIRGQVEFEIYAAQIAGGAGSSDAELAPRWNSRLKELVSDWEKAEKAPVVASAPDDGDWQSEAHQSAVRRGYDLFIRTTGTECLKCHGDFGRKPVLRYDVWGTIARPANFTDPPLKGGIRPEDVYARIRWGIAPVGMPAHPTLTDRQVWDLVRFVRSAPFPRELPRDIRDRVYPNP